MPCGITGLKLVPPNASGTLQREQKTEDISIIGTEPTLYKYIYNEMSKAAEQQPQQQKVW